MEETPQQAAVPDSGYTTVPPLRQVSSEQEPPFELTNPEPTPAPQVCFVQIGDVRMDLAGYAGFNVDMAPLERGASPTVEIRFFPATPQQLADVAGQLLKMVRAEWNNELARLAAL